MKDRFRSNMMRAAAFGTARILERSAKAVGWTPVSFEPETLEAAARRSARLEDFGDPYYREGLGHLVNSLERDADLHPIGRVYMRRIIVNALVNRLRLQEHKRVYPEIHARPLRPPIIITGLPRTGSTLLHRMMSRLPGFFAPPYWMMVRPLPAQPGEPEDVRQATARREVKWWKVITPSVRAKHRVGINLPEECILPLTLTFQSKVFHSLVPVEGYLAWYTTCDRRRKYADYRAILMSLQAARPGQTLLLKAPDHLGALDTLCEAVPEARLVQLHRDPMAVVSSLSSLVYSSQYGLTRRHDPARLAASLTDYLEATLRRNMEQRRSLAAPVLDIHYDRLVADPVGAAALILKTFDEPMPPRGRAAMTKYLARAAKSDSPRHQYKSEDFGLDEAHMAERFSFYSACFAPAPDPANAVNLSLP